MLWEEVSMWRNILMAGLGTLAGSLMFGATIGSAQPMSPDPAVPTADASKGGNILINLTSSECDPLWDGCQVMASPWDHPNSRTDDRSFGE